MKIFKFLMATVVVAILFKSCVSHDISDPDIPDTSDASLFDEVDASGYVYYKSGDMISPAAQSPHGAYRLRFNSVAFQALDANGELPENGRFPTGSILVKETYINSAPNILTVIKKSPTDPNAAEGWLWADFHLDGTTIISISEKGSQCTGCHNDTPNRDRVRTFDLH